MYSNVFVQSGMCLIVLLLNKFTKISLGIVTGMMHLHTPYFLLSVCSLLYCLKCTLICNRRS